MIGFSEAAGIEVVHPLDLKDDQEKDLIKHLKRFNVDTRQYDDTGAFEVQIGGTREEAYYPIKQLSIFPGQRMYIK